MERERKEGPGESREYIVTWPRVKRAHTSYVDIRTRTHAHPHTSHDTVVSRVTERPPRPPAARERGGGRRVHAAPATAHCTQYCTEPFSRV